jgi:hypothetical protein
MRLWRTLERGLGVVSLAALLVLACGEPKEDALVPPAPNSQPPNESPSIGLSPDETPATDSEPEPENGQTGSPGMAQCFPSGNVGNFNPSCAIDETAWTQPAGSVTLLRSSCGHEVSYQALPMCQCTLRMARSQVDAATGTIPGPYEIVVYPGNRSDGCSEYARTPACLYCEREFPGCSVDDATSCDAVCAEMTARYDAELQKTFTFHARVARCKENTYCEWVTEIDGKCYAREPQTLEMPAFDCSLSDAEILQHADEYGGSCPARSTATCTSALDCPRGLACAEGRCVPCSGSCPGTDGNPISCGRNPLCGDDEACVEGLCIPADNVTCRSFVDCPENQLCVLSGMDLSAGRGNGETRSFCGPPPAY